MKMTIGIFLTVLLGVLVNGCSPLEKIVEKGTVEQLTAMTPQQIEAWKNAGQSVYACIQVNGPPAGGSATIMIVPSTAFGGNLQSFGSDCHPIAPPVVVQAPTSTTTRPTTTTTPSTTTTTVPLR